MIFTECAHYLPTWILVGMIISISLYILDFNVSIIICCLSIFLIPFLLQKILSIKALSLCVGAILGFISMMIASQLYTSKQEYGDQRIVCKILECHEITKYQSDFRYKYTCKLLNNDLISKKCILKSNDQLQIGKTYRISTKLYPLPKPAIPGSHDMRYSFFFDRIIGFGQIADYNPVSNQNDIKNFLQTRFETQIMQLESTNQEIVNAILLGKSLKSDNLRTTFEHAGLGYLLAISGLHFGVIISVCFGITRWIIGSIFILVQYKLKQPSINTPLQNIGGISSIVGCILYSSIASLSNSALRNMLSSIIPIASCLNLKYISKYNSVILSAILILLIYPYSILSPGMQLSLLASLMLTTRQDKGIKLVILLTIFTAPVSMYWFGNYPIQPLLGSILCAPIFSIIIMPSIILWSILGMPQLFLQLIDLILTAFIKIITYASHLHLFELHIKPRSITLVFWFIAVFLHILLKNKKLSKIFIAFSSLFLFIPIKSTVFIDYSGHNISIYDKGIIWALDPSSFHAQQSALIMSTRNIMPLKANTQLMPESQKIHWNKCILHLTKNLRFNKAIYNGNELVSRWEMYKNKKPCALIKNKNNISVAF